MARSEAQAMLRVARRDLRAARLLAVDEADEASWGFQVQQSIEKTLKAWILSCDRKAPFTHDITYRPTCSFPNSLFSPFNSAMTTNRSRWISIVSNGSRKCRLFLMKWISSSCTATARHKSSQQFSANLQ